MQQVLITGANRGIGFELTRQLLERGECVFAACRQPERADGLQALKSQFPDQLTIVALDVTVDAAVMAAATAVTQQTNRLDMLINNAGILYNKETVANFDPTLMQHTFEVNVFGVMRVITQFLPLLRNSSEPKLVNISSQLGSLQKANPGWKKYSYNSSKAALNMLTRMLSFEFEQDGIAVTAVHPGWVQTDMGGPEAAVTPPDSAAGILQVTDNLTLANTGKFYTFSGEEHLW